MKLVALLALVLLPASLSAQVVLRGSSLIVSQATAVNPPAPTGLTLLGHFTGADGTNPAVLIDGFGAINPNYVLRRANGTSASPSGLLTGNALGFVTARGYGATGYAVSATGALQFTATENFTDTAQGTSFQVYTTPNGSVTRGLALTVDQDKSTIFGGAAILLTHTPSSSSDTGVAGTVTWDASYIYVCVATNTWKRVAITTW